MQEITPIPGRRKRHETPTRAMTSCHATHTWRDIMTSHLTPPCDVVAGHFRLDKHLFFHGFHTKRVAVIQKLFEIPVGDCSVLCMVQHAETFSVRKKWRRSNLKKVTLSREGLSSVTKTLCTQKEANAFSL
jgi:hypothetical protein